MELEIIFWVFTKLSLKYGQKWTSILTDDPEIRDAFAREWAEELSGLSHELIKYGVSRCSMAYPDWPPTVGQFRNICKPDPASLGIPSTDAAWFEICSENIHYSHGVVLAARNDPRCDIFNWRLLSREKGKALFALIYEEYINRALQGEEFKIPTMVEDKVGRPVTKTEMSEIEVEGFNALNGILRYRKK